MAEAEKLVSLSTDALQAIERLYLEVKKQHCDDGGKFWPQDYKTIFMLMHEI